MSPQSLFLIAMVTAAGMITSVACSSDTPIPATGGTSNPDVPATVAAAVQLTIEAMGTITPTSKDRAQSPEVKVVALSTAILPDSVRFSVYFIDVGQGDATLITTDSGYKLLIDGGRSKGRIRDRLSSLNIDDLDAIVVTYPDADHIAGLIEVLKIYDVEHIYLNGGQSSSATYATVGNQQKWDTFVKERSGGCGSIV
jgi:beta-lactamase superfamily II metal-dependent hydrolase